MKTITRIVIGLVLSFMLSFTGVGYAELTGHLAVSGQMAMKAPEAIFITDMELVSSTVAEKSAQVVFPTTLECAIKGSYGSKVTYKITVLNNTLYEFAYSGIAYETSLNGYEGNDYIGKRYGITISTTDDEDGAFNSSDVLEAGESVTFYVTYTLGYNVANAEMKTLINFKFGVNVDSVSRVAIDTTITKFEDVLNDTAEGGGYATLVEKIDDKYTGADWSANFIGNVSGAEEIGVLGKADTETISKLFGDNLTITIDGVETNVTVLIKRENVDDNTDTGDDYVVTNGTDTARGTGCEMTLYLTTDELKRSNSSVPVYAVVFTCDKNEDGTPGEWYRIGELYAGTATVVGYVGNTSTQNTGSFDTGTWRSTYKVYQSTAGYSYTVTGNRTIQQITQATDRNARTLLKEQLVLAQDLLAGDYGSFAGEAVTALQTAFDNAARCYTISNGTITVNSSATRSQLIPLLQELEVTLAPFASIIAAGKVT